MLTPFEIRKRVQFSADPIVLAPQVSDLARDVIRAGRESVALDGSNGPLTAPLDAGDHAIENAVTVTHGAEPAEATPNEAATLVVDWGEGQHASVILAANALGVQFVEPPGVGRFVLYVSQDPTGGYTVAGWDDAIIWEGGTAPVITAAADAQDKLVFDFDGAFFWGEFRQNYS